MIPTLHLALLLALWGADCGAGARTPAQLPSQGSAQSGPSAQTVTGRERVEWDQELLAGTSIEAYEFFAYVNGAPVALTSVVCNPAGAPNNLVCSAVLPPLRAGRNTLHFVARLDDAESARSEPLDLDVTSTSSRAMGSGSPAVPGVSTEIVANGLESPTDLAMLPDGRLLIAERLGRVRVFAAGSLLPQSALVIGDIGEAPAGGLFAIAAHPDFERNRLVYLAYAAKQGSGGVYRVIRARELNNTLGEIAVVHESSAVEWPAWISLRFGPDGKMYVGVAACTACRSPLAGAVLRLNDDGSTPRDNASVSPVYLGGLMLPVGLSWRDGQMWIGDWRAQSTSILVAADGELRPLGSTNAGAVAFRAGSRPPLVLPTRPRGLGMHWYQHTSDAAALQHVWPLFDDHITVHAVLHAADGALYVCVSDGPDGVVRLMRVTDWQ